MKSLSPGNLRLSLFMLAVILLVCLPFIFFGEAFAVDLLEAVEHKIVWLVTIAVALLASDAILPVPSSWVLMFLAREAGLAAGIIGGTAGLCGGVLVASWIGRAAVGRAAPRFLPPGEFTRLRESMQRQAGVTLACMRSVPVLAETSVLLAAAAGVPLRRIFLLTLLPNLAIAVIYSLAADDSLLTAGLVFLVTIGVSYGYWRWHESRSSRENRA